MRTVLMFCEKFPPYNVSGTARPYYFAKYLPEFGYAPTVVSNELPEDEVPDWTLLEQLSAQVECHRARPLLRFTYHASVERRSKRSSGKDARIPGKNGKSAVLRRSGLRAWVEEARWATACLVDWNLPAGLLGARFVADVDLIWATFPHVRNLVPAYILSRLWNKPLVVDLRDPWTYGSLWNPATRRIERWERSLAARILSQAQRVVLTSPLTMLEMQKRFPEHAERMLTITNGYAEIEVQPERVYGQEKFLLRYIGMLNQRRTPDVLLEGLRLALENQELAEDLQFEFIGSMGGHESKLTDSGLRGVVKALGQVSHERSLALIKGSDVNVLLQTIDEGQDVIAGKTFEYLAAGRPILAIVDEGGGDAWLLRESNAGIVVNWRDPRAIALALTKAWKSWKAGQLRDECSAVDMKRYTRRALTGRLAEVFDEVVTR